MRKQLGALLLGLLLTQPAFAGSSTISVTPGTGATYDVVTDGSGNFVGQQVICDQAAGAQCATVTTHNSLQVDTATSNNNLYAALTAAVPCLNATAFNTNSYSTGQTNPTNCDLQGNLYTSNNVVNWGGVALGAMANYGTSPGAVKVPGFNGFITNTVTTTTAAADPCQANAQVILPFTIPTNTTTNVLTGTSAKKIYVCYLYMQTGLANNVAVIEGTTGGTCGSSTKALVGGTTAATGLLNAANSGQAFGNGGFSVLQTTVNNNDICMITSASGPLSGVMKYVLQ